MVDSILDSMTDSVRTALYPFIDMGERMEEQYTAVLQNALGADGAPHPILGELKDVHAFAVQKLMGQIEDVSIEDFSGDVSSLDKLCIVAGGRCVGW